MRLGVLLAVLAMAIGPISAQEASKPQSAAARAEAFYQRGLAAEALSDQAFARWVKTIDVGSLDRSTDRWVYALDMYTNALYLDPAHRGAHKQLGLIYAEGWGSHANDYMALMHLVASLALAPDDPDAVQQKVLADRSLRRVEQGLRRARFVAEDAYTLFMEVLLGSEETATEGGGEGGGEMAGGMAGGMPSGGEMGMSEGGMGEGGMGEQTATAEVEDRPAPRDPVRRLEDNLRFLREYASAAGDEERAVAEAADGELGRSASHVTQYLATMGLMHRMMRYWDWKRLDYDARLPNALIGECIVQMRQLYTRGKTANLGQLRAEHGRYAGLGGIAAADLWNHRDYATGLPEYLFTASHMEEAEIDEQYWSSAAGTMAINIPQDGCGGMLALAQSAVDISDMAVYEWLGWRNVHFQGLEESVGVSQPEDVFLRDYVRLGTGDITTWPMGPLAEVAPTVGELTGERDWLVAAR